MTLPYTSTVASALSDQDATSAEHWYFPESSGITLFMTSVPFRYLNIRFLSTLRDLPSLYQDMLGVGLVLALQSRIAFSSSLIDTFLGFEAIFGCSKYKII